MLNFDHEHPFIHKIRLRFQGKVLRGVKMRKKSIGTILAIFFLSIVFTANTWSGEYKESPMLAEMVARGELPPVEERLPANPKVIAPVGEIGKYGGTFIRGTAFFTDDERLMVRIDGNSFFEHNKPFPREGPIQANTAEKWKWNADGTELTVSLRKGIKWSDGEPFTVDDVLFFFEDILGDKKVTFVWQYHPMYFDSKGNLPKVTKVDDFTVKFEFSEPSFLTETKLATTVMTAMPKHYLSQFHPKYNASAKYDDFNTKILFKTSGHVTLNGWMLKEFVTDERAVLVRNPYYWKVDTAGQQLPYFDRVEIYTAGDRPAVALGNVVGKYDHDHMWVGMPHLSMFLEEQAKRDFHIGYSDTYGMQIHFNFDCENEEARAVMRNTDVRRAIAIAINQPAINSALLFDTGKSTGCGWLPDSPYYNEKYANLYSEYDPEGAKKMLDEAGIIDRNNDGIRELPTGEKCELVWDTYAHDLYTPMSEMIVEDVAKIGINIVLNQMHQTLRLERLQGGQFEMGQGDYNYAVEPFLAESTWAPQLKGYPIWHSKAFQEKGFSPEIREYFDLMLEGPKAPADRRLKMGRRAHQLMAENVWNIHVLLQKRPYITSNRLGNMVTKSTRIQEFGNFDPPFRFYQVYGKYPQGKKPKN